MKHIGRWHGFFEPFPKKAMKKIYLMLAVAAFTFASCGNNAGSDKSKIDSSAAVVNPPDNSAATNPSLADTIYNKDSVKVKRDSIK